MRFRAVIHLTRSLRLQVTTIGFVTAATFSTALEHTSLSTLTTSSHASYAAAMSPFRLKTQSFTENADLDDLRPGTSPPGDASRSLFDAFRRVLDSGLFEGSHVSLDHDAQGTLTLNIAPDWLEASAVRCLVNLASELELSLVLTKDGVRISEQSDDMVRAVQAVKDTLAADREEDEDDD